MHSSDLPGVIFTNHKWETIAVHGATVETCLLDPELLREEKKKQI